MRFGTRSYRLDGGEPPLVIAEVGVNHNGDLDTAFALVDAAIGADADIVKFQFFDTTQEISRFAELAPYQQANDPNAVSQFEMCKALELSPEEIRSLSEYCARREIGFLCSVFDRGSLNYLADDLDVASMKIASGEITNLPFLRQVGSKRRPVLLSSGASTLDDVATAYDTLKEAGCPEIALFHCVSSYPAPLDQLNLRSIVTLATRFSVPVGFSDHSEGISAAIAAVALGATFFEKHLTLDRNMEGPDHKASLEPDELKAYKIAILDAYAMLGDGQKRPAPCELENVTLIRRGLVATRDLVAGTVLAPDLVAVKRPATGIPPKDLELVFGRKLKHALREDEPIRWDDLD